MTLDDRCYLCRRVSYDAFLVDMAGAIRGICETCWVRGQEAIEIPLDMTEDEEFQNREGQPEFNGAFG